jgi:signal transduction histidine kinase
VAILVFITVATGTVAVVALQGASSTHERIDREFATDMLAIEDLRAQAEALIAARRAYMTERTPENSKRLTQATDRFRRLLGQLHDRNHDRASVAYLAAINQAATEYINATAVGNHDSDLLLGTFENFELSVTHFVDHQNALFEDQLAQARASTSRQQAAVLLTTGLVLALSVGLAALVMRRLDTQFRAEQSATAIAKREAAARQEVLAVVSHDLRTPLTTIVMGSALLAEVLPGDPTRGPQRHVKAIRNAADRMTNLIDELLDTARIDAGTIKLHRTRCDAGEILDKAIELFESRSGKNVAVRTERPPPDTFVHADPERVLQILNNLIANAVKFSPDGGYVTAGAAQKDGLVEFIITDTGPGIPPEKAKHLFERYWQGEGENEARQLRGSLGLGLGLGLPIAKSLVEAHGGRIWVDGAPGGGSQFHFTLPV